MNYQTMYIYTDREYRICLYRIHNAIIPLGFGYPNLNPNTVNGEETTIRKRGWVWTLNDDGSSTSFSDD